MSKKKENKKETKAEKRTRLDLNKIKKGFSKFRNSGLIILIIIGVVLGVGVLSCFGFEYYYQDKVYPRVSIGEKDVSGMSFMQVLDELDEISNDVQENGLAFSHADEKVNIEPWEVSLANLENPEAISEIITFNNQELAEQVYDFGRKKDYWNNFKDKLYTLLFTQQVELDYTLNQEDLIVQLEENFSEYETPAVNAQLSFVDNELIVSDEEVGEVFDYQEIVTELEENLNNFENTEIKLVLETDEPEIEKEDTKTLVDQTEAVLDLAPLTLTYEDKSYEASEVDLQSWLYFSDQGLDINEESLDEYLVTLAEEIDVPVQEGKFSLQQQGEEVTLTQFQESQDGIKLNNQETREQIKLKLLDKKISEIELVVEVDEPKVTPDNIQTDIKELLGTGYTNFSGSPYNRRLNIAKGADILNGLLIAPDETFSLVEALGEIDGEHGWYQELVIKENETIPEYGGGLCQIGTTTFRTAMMSGLEIVERQNHSYAVSYYNYNGKPGVDATIYDPKPDMRFKNDTGHYILWRSRIEGYDIYFEFWGTSDGRNGYFNEPANYNYKSPPPTKEIESDELGPGERNCTENAHTGLTADFDYVIERADGTEDVRNFKSVYKAWPAVCLVGKEDEEDKKNEETEAPVEEEEVVEEEKEDTNKKKKKKKKKD